VPLNAFAQLGISGADVPDQIDVVLDRTPEEAEFTWFYFRHLELSAGSLF
jgi:hypothetical protein